MTDHFAEVAARFSASPRTKCLHTPKDDHLLRRVAMRPFPQHRNQRFVQVDGQLGYWR